MSKENETMTITKVQLWQYAAVAFFVLFIVASTDSWIFSDGASFNSGNTGNAVVNPTPSPSAAINIELDSDSPVLGDKNANIHVIEFSDFQCPFCARAATGTIAELKASSLFKNGEINFIYRHFPLSSIHPFAQKAAEASECANRQDKFWEYHDLLFANANALDTPSLKSYASQLGLNQGDFNSCLDGGEASAKVSKDLKAATDAGGRGTPYFVIYNSDNGKTEAVSGAVPFSNIESAINAVK
ncbi:MAG: DsbA family protein [Nanoarchaeota archaeon]|nr:DsbA family protein [Nanoarchaeota archaeon]